jgi:osmotically-inducible protein OsmY
MKEKQHTDSTGPSEADVALRQLICDKLDEHPKLDVTHITIEVTDGKVILSGKADTEEEKQLAGTIATSVPGVQEVKNELHIGLGIAHALSVIATRLTEGDNKTHE